MQPSNAKRFRAISLVEVIFAMGVILIGLVGVMSILPLAGRRAQDSVSLSVGAAMGDSVVKQLSSHRWFSSGRLITRNLSTGVFEVIDGSEPFCIDPAFVSGNTFSALSNGYETRLFPFFKENHDPTVDPSIEHTAGNAWPAVQPRMRRVGISRQTSPIVAMTLSEAFHVADSGDDLLVKRPQARTDDIFRPGFRATAVPGGLSYASRFGTGEFSWIATVNPRGDGYATLSVAIIRNRQRSFAVPEVPATNPERNTTDERLAYVSFASGFVGGAGGEVHLVSNSNTVFRIRSGDWIMLSNTRSGTTSHRWYRVAAADALDRAGEPERFSGDPGALVDPDTQIGTRLPGTNSRQLWRRTVYLSGPDWDFGYKPNKFADDTDVAALADNTFATLVENVVSVTEHVIRLNSF
jgi:hypothetical protein